MRLSGTVFEILSLRPIFQILKRSRDSDHAVKQFVVRSVKQLQSLGYREASSTHIPNLKCLRPHATKKWKAMPNVKILVFSHPLGDLGVTHGVHLWLDGKRIVDFLLAIIELFFTSSHGYGTSKRNRSKFAFSEAVGHFERKFLADGDVARNSSMDRWIEEWCSYDFSAGRFHTKENFVADVFRQKLNFTEKKQNRVLCHPLGYLWVTYTIHLWLVGKRVIDYLLVLIELFSPAPTVQVLWANWSKLWFLKGGGSLWAQISGEGGFIHQRLLASEN